VSKITSGTPKLVDTLREARGRFSKWGRSNGRQATQWYGVWSRRTRTARSKCHLGQAHAGRGIPGVEATCGGR